MRSRGIAPKQPERSCKAAEIDELGGLARTSLSDDPLRVFERQALAALLQRGAARCLAERDRQRPHRLAQRVGQGADPEKLTGVRVGVEALDLSDRVLGRRATMTA
ncbi:MAG: hypothetical protein HC834_03980 [Rhodospirillales bacterium]|nr:hypothetical protein [Rhodospirillales bacterium]